MLNGGGRSLKNFSEQLEAFVKDHLPSFTMQYDLPSKKGEDLSPYQMAVRDNQLFMSIEITCRSLRKETQRNGI
jgi:hypothetical protein